MEFPTFLYSLCGRVKVVILPCTVLHGGLLSFVLLFPCVFGFYRFGLGRAR